MSQDRVLVVVLRGYVAVSVLCVALGVTALLYRAVGHGDDVSTLWSLLVVAGASVTATAGLVMLAILRRSPRE